ncbi:MAG: copper homeostasis protein CutC [Flavobacteriales bacterium]|nr:copper homeostasis protein CutC [Flavobacteriales bacterium]
MVKIEVCTGTYHESIEAGKAGATRIELCSALSIGGLTPGYGTTTQIVKGIEKSCEVHVMIRPREGGFTYSDQEFEAMKAELVSMAKIGVQGVVFGFLKNKEVDLKRTADFVALAKKYGLTTTFHRAIDVCENPIESVNQLSKLGVDRILTSGKRPTAIEGVDLIRSLIEQNDSKIEIMPGSGINAKNATEFVKIGATSIHFTARKSITNVNGFGFGEEVVFDTKKFNSIKNQL